MLRLVKTFGGLQTNRVSSLFNFPQQRAYIGGQNGLQLGLLTGFLSLHQLDYYALNMHDLCRLVTFSVNIMRN